MRTSDEIGAGSDSQAITSAIHDISNAIGVKLMWETVLQSAHFPNIAQRLLNSCLLDDICLLIEGYGNLLEIMEGSSIVQSAFFHSSFLEQFQRICRERLQSLCSAEYDRHLLSRNVHSLVRYHISQVIACSFSAPSYLEGGELPKLLKFHLESFAWIVVEPSILPKLLPEFFAEISQVISFVAAPGYALAAVVLWGIYTQRVSSFLSLLSSSFKIDNLDAINRVCIELQQGNIPRWEKKSEKDGLRENIFPEVHQMIVASYPPTCSPSDVSIRYARLVAPIYVALAKILSERKQPAQTLESICRASAKCALNTAIGNAALMWTTAWIESCKLLQAFAPHNVVVKSAHLAGTALVYHPDSRIARTARRYLQGANFPLDIATDKTKTNPISKSQSFPEPVWPLILPPVGFGQYPLLQFLLAVRILPAEPDHKWQVSFGALESSIQRLGFYSSASSKEESHLSFVSAAAAVLLQRGGIVFSPNNANESQKMITQSMTVSDLCARIPALGVSQQLVQHWLANRSLGSLLAVFPLLTEFMLAIDRLWRVTGTSLHTSQENPTWSRSLQQESATNLCDYGRSAWKEFYGRWQRDALLLAAKYPLPQYFFLPLIQWSTSPDAESQEWRWSMRCAYAFAAAGEVALEGGDSNVTAALSQQACGKYVDAEKNFRRILTDNAPEDEKLVPMVVMNELQVGSKESLEYIQKASSMNDTKYLCEKAMTLLSRWDDVEETPSEIPSRRGWTSSNAKSAMQRRIEDEIDFLSVSNVRKSNSNSEMSGNVLDTWKRHWQSSLPFLRSVAHLCGDDKTEKAVDSSAFAWEVLSQCSWPGPLDLQGLRTAFTALVRHNRMDAAIHLSETVVEALHLQQSEDEAHLWIKYLNKIDAGRSSLLQICSSLKHCSTVQSKTAAILSMKSLLVEVAPIQRFEDELRVICNLALTMGSQDEDGLPLVEVATLMGPSCLKRITAELERSNAEEDSQWMQVDAWHWAWLVSFSAEEYQQVLSPHPALQDKEMCVSSWNTAGAIFERVTVLAETALQQTARQQAVSCYRRSLQMSLDARQSQSPTSSTIPSDSLAERMELAADATYDTHGYYRSVYAQTRSSLPAHLNWHHYVSLISLLHLRKKQRLGYTMEEAEEDAEAMCGLGLPMAQVALTLASGLPLLENAVLRICAQKYPQLLRYSHLAVAVESKLLASLGIAVPPEKVDSNLTASKSFVNFLKKIACLPDERVADALQYAVKSFRYCYSSGRLQPAGQKHIYDTIDALKAAIGEAQEAAVAYGNTSYLQWFKTTLCPPVNFLVRALQQEVDSDRTLSDQKMNVAELIKVTMQVKTCVLQSMQKYSRVPLPDTSGFLPQQDGERHCLFPGDSESSIAAVGHHLVRIRSAARRPKRVTLVDSAGMVACFLVKEGDDLRVDNRVLQVLTAIRALMLRNTLDGVRPYSVIPMGGSLGLIQWVPGTATLLRVLRKSPGPQAPPAIASPLPRFHEVMSQLRERFPEASSEKLRHETVASLGIEAGNARLGNILRGSCANSSQVNQVVRRFTLDTVTMSVCSWLLGLGDRHLGNILVEPQSGQVTHVDFAISFDLGRLLRVPERIPCRLTPQILGAMAPGAPQGLAEHFGQLVFQTLKEERATIVGLVSAACGEAADTVQAGSTLESDKTAAPAIRQLTDRLQAGNRSTFAAWKAAYSVCHEWIDRMGQEEQASLQNVSRALSTFATIRDRDTWERMQASHRQPRLDKLRQIKADSHIVAVVECKQVKRKAQSFPLETVAAWGASSGDSSSLPSTAAAATTAATTATSGGSSLAFQIRTLLSSSSSQALADNSMSLALPSLREGAGTVVADDVVLERAGKVDAFVSGGWDSLHWAWTQFLQADGVILSGFADLIENLSDTIPLDQQLQEEMLQLCYAACVKPAKELYESAWSSLPTLVEEDVARLSGDSTLSSASPEDDESSLQQFAQEVLSRDKSQRRLNDVIASCEMWNVWLGRLGSQQSDFLDKSVQECLPTLSGGVEWHMWEKNLFEKRLFFLDSVPLDNTDENLVLMRYLSQDVGAFAKWWKSWQTNSALRPLMILYHFFEQAGEAVIAGKLDLLMTSWKQWINEDPSCLSLQSSAAQQVFSQLSALCGSAGAYLWWESIADERESAAGGDQVAGSIPIDSRHLVPFSLQNMQQISKRCIAQTDAAVGALPLGLILSSPTAMGTKLEERWGQAMQFERIQFLQSHISWHFLAAPLFVLLQTWAKDTSASAPTSVEAVDSHRLDDDLVTSTVNSLTKASCQRLLHGMVTMEQYSLVLRSRCLGTMWWLGGMRVNGGLADVLSDLTGLSSPADASMALQRLQNQIDDLEHRNHTFCRALEAYFHAGRELSGMNVPQFYTSDTELLSARANQITGHVASYIEVGKAILSRIPWSGPDALQAAISASLIDMLDDEDDEQISKAPSGANDQLNASQYQLRSTTRDAVFRQLNAVEEIRGWALQLRDHRAAALTAITVCNEIVRLHYHITSAVSSSLESKPENSSRKDIVSRGISWGVEVERTRLVALQEVNVHSNRLRAFFDSMLTLREKLLHMVGATEKSLQLLHSLSGDRTSSLIAIGCSRWRTKAEELSEYVEVFQDSLEIVLSTLEGRSDDYALGVSAWQDALQHSERASQQLLLLLQALSRMGYELSIFLRNDELREMGHGRMQEDDDSHTGVDELDEPSWDKKSTDMMSETEWYEWCGEIFVAGKLDVARKKDADKKRQRFLEAAPGRVDRRLREGNLQHVFRRAMDAKQQSLMYEGWMPWL
jgi:hypothetical protein